MSYLSRQWLSTFAIVLLAALVALLAWQNHALKAELDRLGTRLMQPQVGMWVPGIQADTLGDGSITLGRSGKHYQVLYFFNPDCNYCLQSLPAVRRIGDVVNDAAATAEFVAVSNADRQATAAYARKHSLKMPVAIVSNDRALASFKAKAVPLLLVVSGDGKVIHSHLGVLDPEHDPRVVSQAIAGKVRAERSPSTQGAPG